MPDRYPAIEDHAVIGDLHTVALVATDGTIDWCCLPRFDSPAVFASLLDADRGGSFAVRSEAVRTRQLYMPDSNVLVTRFLGTDSVGEVVDFMVPRHQAAGRRIPGTCWSVGCGRSAEPSFSRSPAARRLTSASRTMPCTRPTTAAQCSAVRRAGRTGLAVPATGSPWPGRPPRRRLPCDPGEGLDLLLEWGGPPAAAGRGGGRPAAETTRWLLAGLAAPLPLPGALPGNGRALRARPQTARLPADRGARRRADHVVAGICRRRPELGLPVHLDPGCRVHPVRADAPRLHRRGRWLHDVA